MSTWLVWIDITIAVIFALIIVLNFLLLVYGVFNGSFPQARYYLYHWVRTGYRWSIPTLAGSVILASLVHYQMGPFFSLLSVLSISALVGIMAWAAAPLEVRV